MFILFLRDAFCMIFSLALFAGVCFFSRSNFSSVQLKEAIVSCLFGIPLSLFWCRVRKHRQQQKMTAARKEVKIALESTIKMRRIGEQEKPTNTQRVCARERARARAHIKNPNTHSKLLAVERRHDRSRLHSLLAIDLNTKCEQLSNVSKKEEEMR